MWRLVGLAEKRGSLSNKLVVLYEQESEHVEMIRNLLG